MGKKRYKLKVDYLLKKKTLDFLLDLYSIVIYTLQILVVKLVDKPKLIVLQIQCLFSQCLIVSLLLQLNA